MENFTEILIESSLILAVFYLGYILFLSRENNFRQNRAFLLTGLIFSIIVPFVQFPVFVEYQSNVLIQLKTVEIFASGKQTHANSSFFTMDSILKIIYFCGVLFLIVKLLYHLWIISKFRINAKIIKNRYGKVVYTGKRHPVFSFLNYVFVDVETEKSAELDVILEHERVHIVQLHSIDLLLLEVLAIVQWFNPLVWLYLKSIKQNHEYLADRGVIKNGFPLDTYQYVLLNNYSALGFGFANSFNHSLTFKRLLMMKKIKSNKLSALKLMLIVPVVLATVYLASCSKKVYSGTTPKKEINEGQIIIAKTLPPSSEDVYGKADIKGNYEAFAIDSKPEFPGGDYALMQYVAENTIYPKEAMEKGIQGTVYVRFLVDKNGKAISDSVMRQVDQFLEREALRVVNSMPAWKPGMLKGQAVPVYFIVPVQFKLQ